MRSKPDRPYSRRRRAARHRSLHHSGQPILVVVGILAAVLAVAGGLAARFEKIEPKPEPPEPPPVISLKLPPGPAELLSASRPQPLPAAVRRQDRWMWVRRGVAAYPVLDTPRSVGVEIRTPAGRVMVTDAVLATMEEGPTPTFARMVAHASEATVEVGRWYAVHDATIGLHFRADPYVVIEEGLLERQPSDRASLRRRARRDLRAEVAAAADTLRAAIEASSPDAHLHPDVAQILHFVSATRNTELGRGLSPVAARRFVRHGGLAVYGAHAGPRAARRRLQDAVERAIVLRDVAIWRGAGCTIRHLANAYGREVRALETPARTRYRTNLVQRLSGLSHQVWTLIVELPGGTPTTARTIQPRAAWLRQGETEFATWTARGGLGVDHEVWREWGRREAWPGRRSEMPPHIALTTAAGNPAGLITQYGRLPPPSGRVAAETDRYVALAARVLPTWGYIDLLGQYVLHELPAASGFPDGSHRPHRRGWSGIAQVTLERARGGATYGSSREVASLYAAILTRQGEQPLLLEGPDRAACVVLREASRSQWYAHMLGTGAPRMFSAGSCIAALREAHKALGSTDALAPQHIQVLGASPTIRGLHPFHVTWDAFIDGEVRRAQQRLGLAVHLHTFGTVVGAQEASEEPEALRVRAIAFEAIGRPRDAIEVLGRLLARTDDPRTWTDLHLERLRLILTVAKPEVAEPVIDDVERQLAANVTGDPHVAVRQWMTLASMLLPYPAFERRGGLIANKHVVAPVKRLIEELVSTTRPARGIPPRRGDPESEVPAEWWEACRTLEQAAHLSLYWHRHVESAGPSEAEMRRRDPYAWPVLWFREFGPRISSTPAERLALHVQAVRADLAGDAGDAFVARVASAAWPPAGSVPAPHVLGTPAARQGDLAYLRAAPTFWRARWWALLERPSPDLGAVRSALSAERSALDLCTKRGWAGPEEGASRRHVTLASSLLFDGGSGAASLLRRIAHVASPQELHAVDGLLARVARHTPTQQYRDLVASWILARHDPASCFRLAHDLRRRGHGAHALWLARAAVARHPSIELFRTERAWFEADARRPK